MSYLYNTSDNGSPSFSRISLSSLRSHRTDPELSQRVSSKTSTLKGRRGRGSDPNEDLTYIPGRSIRDSFVAGNSIVDHSIITGGASKLDARNSPSPQRFLSSSRISGGPLFASRISRRRLLPEDEESTPEEEDTILPANPYNRTVDTVRLEEFSDLSVVHQLKSDPQQISRLSAKAGPFRNHTTTTLVSRLEVPPSSPPTHFDSSQITVVPTAGRKPPASILQQEQLASSPSPSIELPDLDSVSRITAVPKSFRKPSLSQLHQTPPESSPSPTIELPGLESISRITAVPNSFRNRSTSISQQQQHHLPPQSPTGEIPYSPGFEKRIVEEADRENAQFKLSTFRPPRSGGEDSTFDADNLPSFHFSSPLASSTPRPSKFFGKASKSGLFDDGTISDLDQYQGDESEEGDVTILPANPTPMLSDEDKRPMSRNSMNNSGTDDSSDSRRKGRRKKRQSRRESLLFPIAEVSHGSSFIKVNEQRRATENIAESGSKSPELSTIQQIEEWVGRRGGGGYGGGGDGVGEGSDNERRSQLRKSLDERDKLTGARERRGSTSQPGPSDVLGDQTVIPLKDTRGLKMTMPRDNDNTETIDWLKAADLATPQARASKNGVFSSYSRPSLQQQHSTSKENLFGFVGSKLGSTELTSKGSDRINSLPPETLSLFSTSMANVPASFDILDPLEGPATGSPPIPELETPKMLHHITIEEESTADVTKEMEIAGTPVTIVRPSRKNRESSKSPEDIAATESEVRDALRAFSRHSSASPSNDYRQADEMQKILDKGKGKQIEEQTDAHKMIMSENPQSDGVASAKSTTQLGTRHDVVEKLRGVGTAKPFTSFHSGPKARDTQGTHVPEIPTTTAALGLTGEKRLATTENLMSPQKGRTLAGLLSPKRKTQLGGLPGFATTALPGLGTAVNGALPAPFSPKKQLNTVQTLVDVAARDAQVASALRRRRDGMVDSQPKPLPRPSTPESRKQKAHLYEENLESPGSDYNFMDDQKGLDDLLLSLPENPPKRLSQTLTQIQQPSKSQEAPEVLTSLQQQPTGPKKSSNFASTSQTTQSRGTTEPSNTPEAWGLRRLLFGNSKPLALPIPPATHSQAPLKSQALSESIEFTKTTQPSGPINGQSAAKQAQSATPTLPQAIGINLQPKRGSNLPLASSGSESKLTLSRKGTERATLDDPTQDSIHELLANDAEFASLLSSTSERDSEYETTDPRLTHQRVPRELGDNEIEANPRFILRLKEAEIAMLSKMSNKLQTLQLELRSTKRGIELLERKLGGVDSGGTTGHGIGADNTELGNLTTAEWTAEEREALRHVIEELSASETSKLAEEKEVDAAKRRRAWSGAGDQWTIGQKIGLGVGLMMMTGLICLLLEILMLLVSVRVPCRGQTEYTDAICNLRLLPAFGARIPVDEGDDLELIPLASPLLWALYQLSKVPGRALAWTLEKIEGIGGISTWGAGWVGWAGTGLWGLFISGMNGIWELIGAAGNEIWGFLQSWGGVLAFLGLWIWKIVVMILSSIWAVLSWGTKFTPSTSKSIITSSDIPTLSVSPSPDYIFATRATGGGEGSMSFEDETVPTIFIDAGKETATSTVEKEDQW